MAPLNFDGSLIEKSVFQRKPEVVKMQNGCICCTLRQDLVEELRKLGESKEFDMIVIESTGISEPMQVAETFAIGDLSSYVRLDTCVTVVDVNNFHSLLSEGKQYSEVFKEEGNTSEEEEQSVHISKLLVDQVEFANVIILNKVDLANKTIIESASTIIKALNPSAKILTTVYSQVDLDEVLNTSLFSFEEAQLMPGWLKSLELESKGTLQSELDLFGIESFIYRRFKPFNPLKLYEKCCEGGEFFKCDELGIVRSKGYIWLAGPEDYSNISYEWEQAGRILTISSEGFFLYALKEDEFNELPNEIQTQIKSEYSKYEYGDRRQEIVFIGYNTMDKEKIQKLLDDCLIDDEEFKNGPEFWTNKFGDEFPEDFMEEEDDMEEDGEDDVDETLEDEDEEMKEV